MVDLTQDSRPEVRLMTLPCGDINGDGMINNADVAILWLQANFNKGPVVVPWCADLQHKRTVPLCFCILTRAAGWYMLLASPMAQACLRWMAWALSSAGRAFASHARGHRFKSCSAHVD